MEWKNRDGDTYTFTLQEDGSILWEGKFEYYRAMHPTIYEKAYQQYRKDGGNMHIDTFREKIHEFKYKNGECIGLAEIGIEIFDSVQISSNMNTPIGLVTFNPSLCSNSLDQLL